MRGFTTSLFNVLLGWIRTLVETIWDLAFSDGTSRWLQWIAENWFGLVVILCLAGVVIDYFIWFVRWRPYYVWGSKLRRLKRLFSGRQVQDETAYETRGYAPQADRPVRPAPAPVYTPQPAMDQEETYWEEAAPSEPAAYETVPESVYARPRKVDYSQQYVRRFARPEEEAPRVSYAVQSYQVQSYAPEAYAQGEYAPEYDDQQAYAQEQYVLQDDSQELYDPQGYDELYQEQENPLLNDTQENAGGWGAYQSAPAPQAFSEPQQMPVHPGINSQEFSRRFGWQTKPRTEYYKEAMASPKTNASKQETEDSGEAWEFQSLEEFAPYSPPPVVEVPVSIPNQEAGAWQEKEIGDRPLGVLKSGLRRLARKAGRVLTVDDEEEGKILDGLPPPIDKRRAFHAPVYPSGWKEPDNQQQQTQDNPDFREDD